MNTLLPLFRLESLIVFTAVFCSTCGPCGSEEISHGEAKSLLQASDEIFEAIAPYDVYVSIEKYIDDEQLMSPSDRQFWRLCYDPVGQRAVVASANLSIDLADALNGEVNNWKIDRGIVQVEGKVARSQRGQRPATVRRGKSFHDVFSQLNLIDFGMLGTAIYGRSVSFRNMGEETRTQMFGMAGSDRGREVRFCRTPLPPNRACGSPAHGSPVSRSPRGSCRNGRGPVADCT
ncbi:MAG: hypothetical protein AAF802_17910, partial [Planctomycetota bacterium]